MTKEYGKILMENNLKMNCTTCVSVYMNAVITIDSLGKLKYYQVVKSKKYKETISKN